MPFFGEKELGYQRVKDLIEDTKEFWRRWDPDPNRIKSCIEKYIDKLLRDEIKAAKEIGEKSSEKRLPDKIKKDDDETVVLVLLVGFSFEPLLQSVCAYQPDKVVLVLNERYTDEIDGQMMGTWIEELIEKLLEKNLLSRKPDIGVKKRDEEQYHTCQAQPNKVFQFLTDHLLRQKQGQGEPSEDISKQHVIIDITGAKKSMVSGAYLFGVLTNSRLSYVDFDEYDPEKFRPYGYSCKIGEIDNPYQTFQLASWGDVQRHYRNYAFGEAHQALQRMLDAVEPGNQDSEVELFKSEDIEALQNLGKILRFYESWDAGDIPQAYKHWTSEIKAMGIEAPMVVEVLGPKWQEVAQSASSTPGIGSFAESHWAMDKWATLLGSNHWQVMLTYVQDELAKIQRLFRLQGDARAAFMRAANFHEYTLKVRLIILAHVEDGINVTGGDIFGVAFLKASLAVHFSTDPNKPELLQKFHDRIRIRIEPSQRLEELNLKMFQEWSTVLFMRRQGEFRLVDQFREVRNKAVHSLSVVTQKDAENAVQFIENDWDNLLEVWAPLLLPEYSGEINLSSFVNAQTLRDRNWGDTRFGVPEWKELLTNDKCRIDFLP